MVQKTPQFIIAAGACRAVSEDEAYGIAMRTARERWPHEAGFTNHMADVFWIPPDL